MYGNMQKIISSHHGRKVELYAYGTKSTITVSIVANLKKQNDSKKNSSFLGAHSK